MTKINLLWTGGLDSTYRLVELAHCEVEIQPYYIIDSTRGSIVEERAAMKRILFLLRSKPFVKAKINDVIEIKDSEITSDESITEAWKYLYGVNLLGSQYDYIARFAKQNGLTLEVGLESSHRSKATAILKKYGYLQSFRYFYDDNNTLSVLRIDPEKCDGNVRTLFANIYFPENLFGLAKTEEADRLIKIGCMDIMKSTWFCHRPILGMPCGLCNPCKDVLNEGMAYRVPILGRVLAFMYRKPKFLTNRIYNRIKKLLGSLKSRESSKWLRGFRKQNGGADNEGVMWNLNSIVIIPSSRFSIVCQGE